MKKQIDFWLPHLTPTERGLYLRYSRRIEGLHADCKTIRDRAYQRARRKAKEADNARD